MNRGPQKRLFERNNRIVELRKQELSQREIAEIVGCSQGTVGAVLRNAGIYGPSKNGIMASKESANKRDYQKQKLHDLYVSPIEKVIATVDFWSGGRYEYVSGYTGCDCKVLVRCKECGTTIERSFTTIRHKTKHPDPCPICEENRRAKEKAESKEERERIREEARQQKALERVQCYAERLHPCCVCGNPTTNKKYCSKPCSNKATNHRHELLRRAKIANALVDLDIEIHELFNRDKGICYICGGLCDWSDKKKINNTIVCGEYYPSVDHVIPLAKGGLHSWENVRLAHRGCNTKKRDSMPPASAVPRWIQMNLFENVVPLS